MTTISRTFVFIIYFIALVVLYAVGVDKYSWMSDMDISVAPQSINDESTNKGTVSSLILAFIIIVQLLYFIFEKSRVWKVAAIVLLCAAISLYSFR